MAFAIIIAYLFFFIVASNAGKEGKVSLERKDLEDTLKQKNINYGIKLFFGIVSIIIASIILYDWFTESNILGMDYYDSGPIIAGLASITVLICWFGWILKNLNHRTKYRNELESKIADKEKREALDKKDKELKEKENKQLLAELTSKYGQPGKIIDFWSGSIEDSFIVFPSSKNIYANTQVIPFDTILGCEIKDQQKQRVTGNMSSVTEIRNNNGSTVGRALVGGAVAGPVGAIIGGSTSSKTAETKIVDNRKTIIQHHYYAIISLSTLENPSISVDCGVFGPKIAEEIKAIIMGIVAENNKKSGNVSVADELSKLASLRDQEILTNEEFEQQKKKLLL